MSTPEPFMADAQGRHDFSVEVIPIRLTGDTDYRMVVCMPDAAIYITKEQAMKFFNLSSKE